MSDEGGAVPSGSDRRSLFHNIVEHQFLYSVGGTLSIFLILRVWERGAAGDSNRLFDFFQIISVVFFALLLLRLMLRPRLENAEKSKLAVEGSFPFGIWIAVAAGALSYLRTLPLTFLCDDYAHIELARHPFSVAIIPQFTRGQDGVFYRPLAFFSVFLDYRAWHNQVAGYHLTNIVLHLLCIAGVFFLCKHLRLKSRVCLAAALFFALMPVNVQTVTWMAARFDQMAAAFGIWSVACAAQFQRTGRMRSYWFAIILFVMAVLSKENAYVIPVLWLALRMLPLVDETAAVHGGKRIAIIAGYLAAPAIMIALRFYILSGIGGYRTADAPMALHFPVASIFGLIVRAPGEMLFGWDWLEAGSQLWVLAAVLTGAVFLMLALRMKTRASSRSLILFALIWVFISPAPAHFYFWSPDPGLFVSRTLYFGSMGLAVLIAILLDEAVSTARTYKAWAGFVGLLLFVGTQYNISAWQHAAGEAKDWLAELKREKPSPRPGVTYYIKKVPDQVRGVPFFAAGLESAVRSEYSWREDIHVVTDRSASIPDDAVVIEYGRPRDKSSPTLTPDPDLR